MDEVQGREIWFLNRDVVVVRPAQPFVAWVQALEEEDVPDAEAIRVASNAFLIPEVESEDQAYAWLRGHCEAVFEYMLHDWSADPAEWPEDRGWAEFERWFTCEHIPVAWDMVDEPLSSDPPIIEDDAPEWDA